MQKRALARRPPDAEPDALPALSAQQIQAVTALAGGAGLAEVATAAGVDVRTLFNWRKTPEFTALLGVLKAEARERACAKVQGLVDDAVATLRSLMTSNATPAPVRLKASLAVLEAVRNEPVEPQAPAEPDDNPFNFEHLLGRHYGPALRRIGRAQQEEEDIDDVDDEDEDDPIEGDIDLDSPEARAF